MEIDESRTCVCVSPSLLDYRGVWRSLSHLCSLWPRSWCSEAGPSFHSLALWVPIWAGEQGEQGMSTWAFEGLPAFCYNHQSKQLSVSHLLLNDLSWNSTGAPHVNAASRLSNRLSLPRQAG